VTVHAVARPAARKADPDLPRVVIEAAMQAVVIDLPVDTATVAAHNSAVDPAPAVDTHPDRVVIAVNQAQAREARSPAAAVLVLLADPGVVFGPEDPARRDQVVLVDQAAPVPDARQVQADVARVVQVLHAEVRVAEHRLLPPIEGPNRKDHREGEGEKGTTTRRIGTKRSKLASRTRSPYQR